MKLSISKKITMLVAVSIVLVVLSSSVGSAILLGSKMMHNKEDYLRLSAYSIVQETAMMDASNTTIEAVNKMLTDFKSENESDVTIFAYDTRVFSTLDGATGTKMDSTIWKALQDGEPYFSKSANVNGMKYYAYYEPIMEDGECVGAIFAGQPASEVDNAIGVAMANVGMIGVFSGSIFIFVAMRVAKKIVMKLERLRMVIGTLTANDLSVDFPRYEKLRDEIEVISNEAADFTVQLRRIVGNIVDTSNALNAVSDELEEGMKVAYNSSDEISSSIQNIASGAESQSQDTQSITQQIEGIGRNIDDISECMNLLSGTAARMLEVKDNTMESVGKASKENAVILEDIKEVNRQIDITSKSMDEIKGFVDVIKDIASQTNLLSLNASIEAAHAGEQGKGFAVVAEEIRKLAEQSSNSAKEIEGMIVSLVDNYNLITKKMAVTTQGMSFQNEKIEETKGAFMELDSDIRETVEQIEVITEASKELDAMKNRIVDAICSLSAVSEENSAATEETTASMEELNAVISQASGSTKAVEERAKALKEYVSVFKV